MVGRIFFRGFSGYAYLISVFLVGGITMVIGSNNISIAEGEVLSSSEESQRIQNHDALQKRSYLYISSQGSPIAQLDSDSADPVIQDVLSRISLSAVDVANGTESLLMPEYRLTQTNISGDPSFRIFHYVSKTTPQHYDIEAVVGVNPVGDEYFVEIAKFTPRTINVKVDGENLVNGTIAGSDMIGQLSPGFFNFRMPK
jgi:hypothetical protein